MTTTTAILSGLLLIGSAPLARAQTGDLPQGWLRAGDHPADYEMGIDPRGGQGGGRCAFIRAKADPQGFGTLMQMFDAGEYAGKRLRLSALVRWEGITGWAGLWMRIDGATPTGSEMPAMLGFDNMQDRPLTGTSGWAEQAVVLDVPPEARQVGFGILLQGPGQAWMDDLKLEPAWDVNVTGTFVPPTRNPNLAFDK